MIVPPLAVLFCGKIFQFVLSLVLWVGAILLTVLTVGIGVAALLVPVVHAILVVHGHHADKRHKKLVKTIEKQTAATVAAMEAKGQ